MAYTYILRMANGRYYVGSTDNLDERLKRHRNGLVPSTKKCLPVGLVFAEIFETKDEAQSQEYRIKRWKSKKLIESLIRKSKNNIVMAPSSIG